MGYDMYRAGITDEENARALEATTRCRALREEHNALPKEEQTTMDLDTWSRVGGSEVAQLLWEESDALEEEASNLEGYFRLNIWGMSKCRNLMDYFGMLDWETPQPEYPMSVEHGLSDEDMETYYELDDDGRRMSVKFGEYAKAIKGWEEYVPNPCSGILGYKFCSNDGWLVTPAEIGIALHNFKKYGDTNLPVKEGDEGLPAWWGSWIAYLESSLKGGFRVH